MNIHDTENDVITLQLSRREYDDLLWAANQGAEQVFVYTDARVDWDMTYEEFSRWGSRVAAVIAKAAEQGA